MSGRHRRMAAVPEPTPHGLSAAVAAALDAAQSALDDSAGFEESVAALFTDAVWRLHNDHRMVGWRADPETAMPAVAAASTAALPAVVDDIARRLEVRAAASRVDVVDPESLAEVLARLAHALLLVPDAAMAGRTELGSYVHRHVTPVVRCAVDGEARDGGRPGSARPRRWVRGELLAATVIALVVGSAGWITVVSGSTPPSVAPTNLTGLTPDPQQRGSEVTAILMPSPPATGAPPVSDAPRREAAEPSGRTPAQAAPVPSRRPVIAERRDSSGSNQPEALPPRAGALAGPLPPGALPAGPMPALVLPGGQSARPSRAPSLPAPASKGPGQSNPNSHTNGGHPDGHP